MNSKNGSADRDRDRKRPSKEPFDAIDYHRRLVAAILDKGVEKASPMQIFERMTLPQDPTNYAFRHLQLGQIKSHLQRFRKVYKSQSSQSGGNAKKETFLDDYDNFVDFGLDAAAARSDEPYSSILGGRIIGLVSRMIMINDGVKIQDFSKHHSLQEKHRNADRNVIQHQNLDKTIPKLSVSEHATPLGQSMKLVVGLLHYLKGHIESERHRATVPSRNSYPTTLGQQRSYPNGFRLPPRPEQLRQQQQQQPQQQQLVPNKDRGSAQQNRNPRTTSNISNESHQIQVQLLPQQPPQQHRRERADSLSDVSSIGDARALMTDEDLHFAMLMPKSNKPEVSVPMNDSISHPQRLGKFIPVNVPTILERNPSAPVHLQGRVYHPQPVHPGHQQRIPPVLQQQRIGSFDIPQQVSVKANHDTHKDSIAQHALAGLAATAVAAAQLHSTTTQVPRPQHLLPNPISATNSATNSNRQIPPRPPRRTVSRFPLQKRAKPKSRKWTKRRYKHSTKTKMLQTLEKVLTELGRKRNDFQTKKSASHACYLEPRNPNTTGKTTLENDDDASVDSSLSSSSSSSSLESNFHATNGSSTKPRTVTRLLAMPTQQHPALAGGLVSPANTGSEANSLQHKEHNDWIFHHNPIPQNVKLKIFLETEMEDDEDDDDDDGYNSWCSKNSTSTEQNWGIIKGSKEV